MDRIEQHLDFSARRGLRVTYRNDLYTTLRRLERAVGPLETVSRDTLEVWWDNLSVADASRATYLAHIASFYKWAVREDLRPDDPTARLIRPRLRRRLPRPISPANLQHAIDCADQPLRVWLLLAAFAGLRACEVATLHRDDILPEVLIVRDGKGGKQRIVPLHPILLAELERLPKEGWLFPGRNGPMAANSVSKRMSRYLRDLPIPETFHQCRHAFATAVYRQSRDLRLTQELMGHQSPNTTANYAAWEPDKAASIVSSLRYA